MWVEKDDEAKDTKKKMTADDFLEVMQEHYSDRERFEQAKAESLAKQQEGLMAKLNQKKSAQKSVGSNEGDTVKDDFTSKRSSTEQLTDQEHETLL